jgi:hypothetical protein
VQHYLIALESSSMGLAIQSQAAESVGGLFEVFPDAIGRWCARRIDGLVCGTFLERDGALRFARAECLNGACGHKRTRGPGCG